jgi:catechol 2,3-dioxygenase-like lactoylglutathione lyase family enzyme
MQLEGIDHIAMGVRDIERSAKWYIDVLGFERLHDGMWNGVPTFIGKGDTGIALFPANEEPKTSGHREIRMLHLAFSRESQKFSRCATGTKEARNQIRISESRSRALDLFP